MTAAEAFEQGRAAFKRSPAPMTDAQIVRLRELFGRTS
jgi:hypothetical protein